MAKQNQSDQAAPKPDLEAQNVQLNCDIKTGEWSRSLFDCFNHCVPNGLMSLCCTCVTFAQVAHRIGMMHYLLGLLVFGLLSELTIWSMVFAAVEYSGSLWDSFMVAVNPEYERPAREHKLFSYVYQGSCVLLIFLITLLRFKVRRRFNIEGDIVGDCLLSTCCTWCVAAQMASHVKSYRPGCCSFMPPDQLPPYES